MKNESRTPKCDQAIANSVEMIEGSPEIGVLEVLRNSILNAWKEKRYAEVGPLCQEYRLMQQAAGPAPVLVPGGGWRLSKLESQQECLKSQQRCHDARLVRLEHPSGFVPVDAHPPTALILSELLLLTGIQGLADHDIASASQMPFAPVGSEVVMHLPGCGWFAAVYRERLFPSV